ncbi:MAG: glycosyltransferase [Actinomycetaceae bacterium]|nr:glycosyltransferase [Actinomycetaceae bacterium]
MRVALTKGTLRIPPTYFAVEHALALPSIDWEFFTLAADVSPEINLHIHEATASKLSFSNREKLKYLRLGKMRRQIEQAKPDIIHQHASTWSLPALNASKNLGVPMITTVHGTDLFTIDSEDVAPLALWNRFNTQSALQGSDRIVAVSEYLANQARTRGVDESKLEVIYQGVDTEFFSPGKKVDKYEELRNFVFVGALSDQKGILDLTEASRSLYEKAPHTLKVIGTGPHLPRLLREADRYPHIRVLGSLSRAQVRDHLRMADVLVLPTKTWHGRQEAAGLVLLEAQACGTPVIANAVGGTPEMVAPGLGWLISEYDPEALIRTMAEVIAMSNADLQAISEASREWVIHNRAARVGADQLAQLYTDLIR